MSVLALVTNQDEIHLVVSWAAEFASARNATLTILCWEYSPTPWQPELLSEEQTETTESLDESVRLFISESLDEIRTQHLISTLGSVEVQTIHHPNAVEAMLEKIQQVEPTLAVAAAQDQTGRSSSGDPILSQSPSATVILFGRRQSTLQKRRIFVGTTDRPHDGSAVSLAAKISKTSKSRITIAKLDEENGEESSEAGRLELLQLMRDVSVKPNDRIRRRVYQTSDFFGVAAAADKHDLVLMGANSQLSVQELLENTRNPTIAVIKRAPPLRKWSQGKMISDWFPQISPSDHAGLIQKLRRGSRLNSDFLIMLGPAAAIATLGLLQYSPAIVIGSMLLAPLMTPMIGNGLALSQANPKLGRSALFSVFMGFFMTLAVSYFIAIVTPGNEMTSQVYARGEPNILDLLVALFSAVAAAYAMARPSLAGSVAGVAIATALVPPLCSLGISLAYGRFHIAGGAAVLFVTNLVAIVLGAAATFRVMGVTAAGASTLQRRWVFRTVSAFGLVLIALAFPLQRALDRNIDFGKPQPNHYPLTKATEDAVSKYVAATPDLDLISSGRPSSEHDKSDVILFLSSPNPLPESYKMKLVEIVRREMGDETLVVEVHCLQEIWE